MSIDRSDEIYIWSIHLGRILLWGLISAASLLLFLRCLLIRLYSERIQIKIPEYLLGRKLYSLLAILLISMFVSIHFLIKPNRNFIRFQGEKAIFQRDF